MPEALLTVDEAATRLKMHPATLRRHLRRGEIRAVKRGPRLWRIPESALEAPNIENTAPTFPQGEEAPELDALFASPTPEEIRRRLAALEAFGSAAPHTGSKNAKQLTNDAVAQGYDERAAQIMDGHK